MSMTLGSANIRYLYELVHEWHATRVLVEEVQIEGIAMMRATVWVPDPKQEGDDAPYRFLISPNGSRVQLGPVRDEVPA